MADPTGGNWGQFALGAGGPIARWVTVTPHNTNALATSPCRAVTVRDDTGGNLVALKFADGTSNTIYVAKGQVHPTCATHVLSTGTTATTVQVGY